MSDTLFPEPAPAKALADRFAALMAGAVAEDIALDDERGLTAAFLSAAVAGDEARCRVMADDIDARLGAARAARRIEAQRKQEEVERPARELAELERTFTARVQEFCEYESQVSEWLRMFAEAKAAGNISHCRHLAATVESTANGTYRTPEQERQQGQEHHARVLAEVHRRQARAAHEQAIRERCAHGWDVLGEVEKRGSVRLDPAGAVLYSGRPLDDDLMLAIEYRAEQVRNALRARWQDRVLIPAPAKEAA
ncbi:MAG: hypothetical protein ACREFP_03140 [Acetobacteraceae bacterium]